MACKPKYLVGLLFLELAIGGAGRWFVLPAGISVRILLFISVFAFAFFGLSINERKLQNSPFLLPVLIMGILIPFFWGFGIAIFKGNTLLNTLDDCNGQLFYLL
ncbi:MAG: hypothetical protein O6940_13820, partial [Ignavibacteria bacterium]|nr:hypothetical protein [Ignavibacteria bacterium]